MLSINYVPKEKDWWMFLDNTFQFLTGHYSDQGLIIYGRNNAGLKAKIYVKGFDPYFLVQEDENIPQDKAVKFVAKGFKGIGGEKLKKIVMTAPNEVEHLREQFPKEKRFEDDIRFVRRFLVDSGIKSGFTAQLISSPIMIPGNYLTNFRSLKPADFTLPPKVAYIDVEAFSKSRFPDSRRVRDEIICATFYNSHTRYYTTILYDETESREKLSDNWILLHVPDEKSLLQKLRNVIDASDVDVIASWGSFDAKYIFGRARHHGMGFSLASVCLFNLIDSYEKFKRGSNRLKDVVKREGIAKEVISEEFHSEWWMKDNRKLVEYNKTDVEYIVKLDREGWYNGDEYQLPLRLTEFAWGLKNSVGLEDLSGTKYNGVLVDTMMLRKYRGKYALPSRIEREKEETFKGALIGSPIIHETDGKLEIEMGQPPKGLVDGVGVFDMSRYYLNIIVSKNLTPELVEDGRMGLLPELILENFKMRDEYEIQLDKLQPGTKEYNDLKTKRDSIKYLLLSIYGYFGSPYMRLYNLKIAATVTEIGRKGLSFIIELQKDTNPVKYCHTDSMFIRTPFSECQTIEKHLNEKLQEFSVREGLSRELKLKFDKYYSTVLFAGVKGRYAGRCILDSGKNVDYINIVGFEYVRRDSSRVTRKVQYDIFDMILYKRIDEIVPYFRDIVKELKSGTLPLEDIAITKTLHKNLSDYGKGGTGAPDYVRGSLYGNKYLNQDIRGGDTIKMIPVSGVDGLPQTDVICFLDEDALPKEHPVHVDWKRLISKTVKSKVEKLMELVGLNWLQIEGQKKLTETFG